MIPTVQLNFPLQDNNKQQLVLYNFLGFVVPENKRGKIADYNI